MTPLQKIIHQTIEKQACETILTRDIFKVMAKSQGRWHNIITKTDDIRHARKAMYLAQKEQKFSEIVLYKAREIKDIDSLNWQAIECALPVRTEIVMHPVDVKKALRKIKQNPANKNHFSVIPNLQKTNMMRNHPVENSRKIANIPLAFSVIVAILFGQMALIVTSLSLICTDWLYVEEKMDRFLTAQQLSFFIRYRTVIYFIIASSVLLPAIVTIAH